MRYCVWIVLLLLLLTLSVPVGADYLVEVLMPASNRDLLGREGWCKLGQKLTIHGEVLAIGYRVWKQGNPSGDVIFSLYDGKTDSLIVQKVWGDASKLSGVDYSTYQYVVLDKPVRVDGEVRLCVEFHKGTAKDHLWAGYFSGNKIDGEYHTSFFCYGIWHDIGEKQEGSYYLRYIPDGYVPLNKEDEAEGGTRSLAVVPILAAVGGAVFLMNRRWRRK